MAATDLSKYDNSWYSTKASFVKRAIWYFVNVFFFLNPFIPVNALKVFLLRRFGAKVGKGVIIKPRVNIKHPWLLEIGNHVWIGELVWIDNFDFVMIMDNVCISQEAMLLTGSHNFRKTTFDLQVGPIILEQGVWIGAKAIVNGNVICRSHSVLSINSVTYKNLEPYMIYSGNPAIPTMKREILD